MQYNINIDIKNIKELIKPLMFNQLVEYGIHIGHGKKNSSFLCSWILFKLRQDLWLINLQKTIWFFKLIYTFIQKIINSNGSLWFINMDNSKFGIISEYANICGEFFCINMWKRGLLSNFISMFNTVKKFVMKDIIYSNHKYYNFYGKWYMTRYTWARSIFVSNLKNNHIICKEAISMFIPVISIVDTNLKINYFDLPIPSNDDSLDSLTFICSIISKYTIMSKYKKLAIWLIFYRDKQNVEDMINFLYYFKKIKNKKLKYKFKKFNIYNFNLFNVLKKGINIMFIKKLKINFNINLKATYTNFAVLRRLHFYSDVIKMNWYRKFFFYKNKASYVSLHKKRYLTSIFNFDEKGKDIDHFWIFISLFMYVLNNFRLMFNTFRFDDFLSMANLFFISKIMKYQYPLTTVNIPSSNVYNANDSWRFMVYRKYNLSSYFVTYDINNNSSILLYYSEIYKKLYLSMFFVLLSIGFYIFRI